MKLIKGWEFNPRPITRPVVVDIKTFVREIRVP
jgi:hypothetical protein